MVLCASPIVSYKAKSIPITGMFPLYPQEVYSIISVICHFFFLQMKYEFGLLCKKQLIKLATIFINYYNICFSVLIHVEITHSIILIKQNMINQSGI